MGTSIFNKKNQKIKENIDIVNSFIDRKILSFKNNSFIEKNDSFMDELKANYEFERDLLEQIFLIEEKLSLNFYPFNWPRGFRFESSFYAYIIFDIKKSGFKEYKSYYIINVEEDLIEKEKHRVFFCFPSSNEEISVNDVFDRLGKEVVRNNISINSELFLLNQLSKEELSIIGNLYFKEDVSLYESPQRQNNYGAVNSINTYIKLLKMKYNFTVLRKIESDNCSVVEGVLQFEPLFKSKFRAVFREIEKYSLNIRIYDRDISKIYFIYEEKICSLHDILNYAGINNLKNDNEFKLIMNFSNYDLNILCRIIEDMM